MSRGIARPNQHVASRGGRHALTNVDTETDAYGQTALERDHDDTEAEEDAYQAEWERRFCQCPADVSFRYSMAQYRRDRDAGRTKA
jgi:hypothetical protein